MSSRLARSRARRRKRRARAQVAALGVTIAAGGAFAVAGPILHVADPPGAATTAAVAAPASTEAPIEAPIEAAAETTAKSAGTSAAKASGLSKFTDKKAAAYFKSRWKDGTAKRVRDIRTTGRYLRIYTNLPENAGNSKTAITLCKRGLEYLEEQGERNPVVFVQAKHGGNGNPVLANVLGPDDADCRVTHPEPQ
ncbi:hypothetical protein [Sphaerimonospora thailandensis]|uniref:Uncharacterized protein n=1 Tax=Sphaerimonospora thailandensis TaxID=795644 RepID=A0A8J3VZ48_9ACTN|nr:hypothetical protein [Sphaerimonospora thailandensis]GIH69526.1 hypothetical protein Mth01_17790 [Sphaerimonospora thailandensis]